jgi:hypothetical protein
VPKGHRAIVKHYVYRLDHDTGFAPHIGQGVCTLCGCKTNTIEAWAQKGSWVVGIGGKGTHKSGLLIYAMKVEGVPSVAELRRRSPHIVRYLRGRKINRSANGLLSRYVYYSGHNAISLPPTLQGLTIQGQGCKRLADEAIGRLDAYLAQTYAPGEHGAPNNPQPHPTAQCACTRLTAARKASADCGRRETSPHRMAIPRIRARIVSCR